MAEVIDRALFAGQAAPKRDPKTLEKLRQAVLDKNFYWFNRYRVMDGYNVYGGRAFEKYAEQQSNYEDQQREMEILDVMTTNRDKRIWAVAQGKELKVDDSNTPPFIPVKTNKPGNGPNGEHIYLDGEEAIKKMTLGKNLKVNLFASEKEFPELAKPVQMQFDAKGRLWVAVWPSYPHWKPKEEMNDKILIFEDTDGDGKADKMTVFADKLHCPTGFEFYNGGVLVAQAPDLMFLKDTRATARPTCACAYCTDSTRPIRTIRPTASCSIRAAPFTSRRASSTTRRWRRLTDRRCAASTPASFATSRARRNSMSTSATASPIRTATSGTAGARTSSYDGTGANPYHAALFSGHLDFPQKHAHPPQVYQQRTPPLPRHGISLQPAFPRGLPGQFAGRQRHRLPGHSCITRSTTRAPA